jgi:hypothetical protein
MKPNRNRGGAVSAQRNKTLLGYLANENTLEAEHNTV